MEEEKDYFRESFNHFKQYRSTKVVNDSLDFELRNSAILLSDDTGETSCEECTQLGLSPHPLWQIYSLKHLEGVFLISNPFTAKGQQRWIRKCLEEYPHKPSRTNLDSSLQGDCSVPSLRTHPKLFDRLSWATLGYHYDWDTKVYDRSDRSDFPPCLCRLARHLASARLGFEAFEPEAAIVNYYNRKSRLGIHNDHSEEQTSQPLLSVSFGLEAVFLVGTGSRKERPVPLLLKSGDVVVLSGPCRLSYHAVPAIVEGSYSGLLGAGDPTWEPFGQYMQAHRINVSIRQVYAQ